MSLINDVPIIETFKELLNEISYSWHYPNYDIIKHNDGYSINKLYIQPDQISYKTDNWILAEGVFEEFEAFYELIQTFDNKENYDVSED